MEIEDTIHETSLPVNALPMLVRLVAILGDADIVAEHFDVKEA